MPAELKEGEDFYYEGPFMVFTEKYLRERGFCCESGCRHCPYGFRKNRRSDVPDQGVIQPITPKPPTK